MRFGIVGTNFISDSFMAAVQRFKDDVTVTAVCSGKYENAVKFAEKYNIKNVYKTHLDMIENCDEIDCVYVATPNSLHHDVTVDCLNHHLNVWCEKPMGGNYDEVCDMFETAERNGVYLHDGLVPMYSKNLPILKESLSKIGTIRRAVINCGRYSSRYPAYLRGENPTTFRNELCNGSIMDMGVYAISIAVALFGKPKKIYSSAILLDTKVDGAGECIFEYDGFNCVILHSKTANSKIDSEIDGELGNIYLPAVTMLREINFQPLYRVTFDKKDSENAIIKLSKDVEGHFYDEMEDFINSYKKQLKESERYPHSLSKDIYEVQTKCRLMSGVKYDCDK